MPSEWIKQLKALMQLAIDEQATASFSRSAHLDLTLALQDNSRRLIAIAEAAEEMINDLDNSTGADDWCSSELRAVLEAK